MKILEKYFLRLEEMLKEVETAESDNIEKAAKLLAEATLDKRSIFAFGCNHAGLITLETFYRTGGLVTVNPVRAPGMMLEISPITSSSKMERLDGYGKIIFDGLPIKKDDVLIIHSVSGRNNVPIDMAIAARNAGVKVIVITNMNTATYVSSRHPSGKKLHDFADVLIDNHGDCGDASMEIEGFSQKVAPSSTVIGAAITNAITARCAEIVKENGVTPPVFMSGNIDGGDKHNAEIIKEYEKNIFYM